ncbi:MAG: hypothetical protein FWC99_07225 [Coriobacteriia bacterium]|nr:hypothetical protein [Coriobacteriia bacterium]
MPSNFPVKRIAAIDIGTITTRLLIADASRDISVNEVYRAVQITQLGKSASIEGALPHAGITSVLTVLAEYVQTCKSYHVETLRCVATSAVRDAQNADVLVDGAAKLGIAVEVIGGAEEAQLALAGATYDADGSVLVVDVGGGSTEFILGHSGCPGSGNSSSSDNAEILQMDSLQLGSRRLTDAFISTDPPTAKELQAAREHAQMLCVQYLKAYGQAEKIIAVAGTATTLAAILGKVEPYNPEIIQGYEVTRTDVDRLLKMFVGMNTKERQSITGLDPKRADVIIAGTLILQSVLNVLDCKQFFTSDKDLLYGIALSI